MLYYAEYREGIGTAELVCDTSQVVTQGSTGFAIKDSSVAPFASSKAISEREHGYASLPFAIDCNTQMPSAKDAGQGRVSVHFPRQTVRALPLSCGEARRHSSTEEFVSWAAANEAFPYKLQCAFCRKRLSRERSIVQRAFPLPSEEFKEMAADLFCHGSSNAAQRFMAGELVPRKEECLLSESLIVFRLSSLLQESLLLEEVDQHLQTPSSETDSQAPTQDPLRTNVVSPSQTPANPQDTPSMNLDDPLETTAKPQGTPSTTETTPTETPAALPDPPSTNKETISMIPSALSDTPSSKQYNVRCTRCFNQIGRAQVFGHVATDRESRKDEPVTSVTMKWENVTLQTKGFHPIGGKVCPVLERLELEADFMHKLTTLVGSSGRYRFLLKDPAGNVHACIWHMNSNVCISTNALSTGGLAFEGYSGQGVGMRGSDIAPVCGHDGVTDNGVKGDGLNAKCFRAMKLLYKSCLREAEAGGMSTAASWELDGSVADMVFSLVECLQVLLVLEENNLSLPPAMRVANTFNIAYFKYNTP